MLPDERRSNPRTKLNRLAYIHIEPDNGGIVLNVSGDGLAFHSMNAVQPNGTVRFSLQEQNHRIDVCGKLIWTDEVQKIGGLRFTTLTSEARDQLSDWMSRPEVPAEESHSTLGAAFLRAFPGLGTRDVTRDFGFISSLTAAKAVLKARAQSKLSGFAGGMVTGLLVSMLAASVIYLAHSYRHQFGESLIHLGERLAQKSAQPQLASSQSSIAPAISEASHSAPAAATPSIATPAPVAKAPTVNAQLGRLDSTPLEARLPAPVYQPISSTRAGKSALPQALNPAALKKPQQTASPSKAAPNSAASEAAPPAFTLATLRTPDLPAVSSPTPVAPSSEPSTTSSYRESVAIVRNQGSSADLADGLQMFFDLGKFKQQSAAEALSGQVAQLGLHSSVVPRGHLWMNSYQVLVGPYTDAVEEKKIDVDLLSHGYKPRPFERGSRNFAFRSRVTVDRTKVPPGDCTISWESYVTEAKVKFAQSDGVVATTAAKWMKRPKKYSDNEYVYNNQPDGSRPLVEIHFAGLDRALVFRSLP